MLTVLVRTISNSQVFSLKKCESYSHFFQQNINIYAIFNAQSSNDMTWLSFEQLGPECENEVF